MLRGCPEKNCCVNFGKLPKKTFVVREHFLSIFWLLFYRLKRINFIIHKFIQNSFTGIPDINFSLFQPTRP